MLKTQITGAKYLSPQTNQMTNLNIAVPADSKDTEFGTSDIMLAKDVAAYYYTKEETDNQIQIAKNSEIHIHNEDYTKSLMLSIDDTDAADEYGESVNIFLTGNDSANFANINALDGFRHNSNDGSTSVLRSNCLDVYNETNNASIYADQIDMYNNDIAGGSIVINTNKELTEEEQNDEYSPVDLSLNHGDYTANINAKHGFTQTDGVYKANINAIDGFTHKTDDGFVTKLDGYALDMRDYLDNALYANSASIDFIDNENKTQITISSGGQNDYLQIGSDEKFKISRSKDNTEGATITGIKSLTAFANPSATKVWATDGSTVDLTTKANTSDILLKKSESGGYYIEGYINQLGLKAFAANGECTASGTYSFAEGGHIKASGSYSHAEGVSTEAIGTGSHAEGDGTKAQGNYAHAEGETTEALGNYSHAEGQSTMASGDCSHAEGCNTEAKSYSHAEGNYTHAVGTYTHAEGEYTSANGSYSHAEGFATYSNGHASHSEGYSTKTNGHYSHAEGNYTEAAGFAEHAQGTYNVVNKNAIHSVGIGNNTTRKNAEYIYAKSNENSSNLVDDPKNGYKYLIGVGGYDGVSTDNTTYKSVQEVIADLTARIEQLETKVRALEAANTPA